MKWKSFALGLLCAAVCSIAFLAIDNANAGPEQQRDRYSIKQSQTAEHSLIAITDRETTEQVTIFNGAKDGGAWVGFYPAKCRHGSMPDLAISARGIQVVDSAGKIHFLTLDKLAKLDTKQPAVAPVDPGDEDENTVPSISEQWDLDASR